MASPCCSPGGCIFRPFPSILKFAIRKNFKGGGVHDTFPTKPAKTPLRPSPCFCCLVTFLPSFFKLPIRKAVQRSGRRTRYFSAKPAKTSLRRSAFFSCLVTFLLKMQALFPKQANSAMISYREAGDPPMHDRCVNKKSLRRFLCHDFSHTKQE